MFEQTTDILAAVPGSVTIPTEEYAELQRKSIALDVIFASLESEASYKLSDTVRCVKNALTPVITANEDKSDA